jgi:hypothetical protein
MSNIYNFRFMPLGGFFGSKKKFPVVLTRQLSNNGIICLNGALMEWKAGISKVESWKSLASV